MIWIIGRIVCPLMDQKTMHKLTNEINRQFISAELQFIRGFHRQTNVDGSFIGSLADIVIFMIRRPMETKNDINTKLTGNWRWVNDMCFVVDERIMPSHSICLFIDGSVNWFFQLLSLSVSTNRMVSLFLWAVSSWHKKIKKAIILSFLLLSSLAPRLFFVFYYWGQR